MIDLHVHSNKSDGSFTPAELVELAVQKKLSAFALTDHDTIDGLQEALEAARVYNETGATASGPHQPLEVIPGIEFSTEYLGKDVHIVGLFIRFDSPLFQNRIREFVDSRIHRNRKMCQRLREAGIDITYEQLLEEFPGCVITRSHYARFLYEHGYIRTLKEAFDRYIGDNCYCFVPREKITPGQAVRLIREAGGLSILAHPILYRLSDSALSTLVRELKEEGLDGIEAIYSTYSPGEEQAIRSLATRFDLLISGGSDFHGAVKPGLELGTGYGKLAVDEEILEKMKALLRERQKGGN